MIFHDESLLVYTTRDKRFLRGADKVVPFEVKAAHGDLAEQMLFKHAEFDPDTELSLENKRAFDGILDFCKGLPLAIGIAGGTVSKYHKSRESDKQDAWVDYYRSLMSRENNIIGERADRYGDLVLIVDSSLAVLNRNREFTKTFEEMFRGFCILRKQQKVRGEVLQKLWSVSDLKEAKQIAESFDQVSLVQVTESQNMFHIQLHDLVLDIAMQKASDKHEVKGWFGALVNNYIPKMNDENGEYGSSLDSAVEHAVQPRSNERSILRLMHILANQCFCAEYNDRDEIKTERSREMPTFRSWWDVQDDEFIHNNMCRALHGAGEVEELVWLLERARWIVMRLQAGGINEVEQDLELGMRVGTNNLAERRQYLEVVRSAARMSCVAVVENAYETWFQMYGRMAWYGQHCERTRIFLREIEEQAPRPWVKPSVGILENAGELILETFSIEDDCRVLNVFHAGDMIRILVLVEDHVLFVYEYDRTYGTKTKRELDSAFVDRRSSGNVVSNASVQGITSSPSKRCFSGAFSDSGNRLVTGYEDAKVVLWDVEGGYSVYKYLTCNGSVSQVSISGDGQTVAYSLFDGRVYVWDADTEANAGTLCATLSIVEDMSYGIQLYLSVSGKRVVYYDSRWETGDRNFHLLDRDIGGEIDVPSEMQSGDVSCVAMSGDGKRVVSGSDDGTMRIWNVDCAESCVQTMDGGGTGGFN